MKNLLEHYKARIRQTENQIAKNKMISADIKYKAKLKCYETFVNELERLILKK